MASSLEFIANLGPISIRATNTVYPAEERPTIIFYEGGVEIPEWLRLDLFDQENQPPHVHLNRDPKNVRVSIRPMPQRYGARGLLAYVFDDLTLPTLAGEAKRPLIQNYLARKDAAVRMVVHDFYNYLSSPLRHG